MVNQRNELVLQRDEEERMIENDEQIEQDITIPDEQLVRGKTSRDAVTVPCVVPLLGLLFRYYFSGKVANEGFNKYIFILTIKHNIKDMVSVTHKLQLSHISLCEKSKFISKFIFWELFSLQ